MPSPKDETFTESPAAQSPLVRPEPHVFVALECERPLAGCSRHSLRGITEVVIGRGTERAVAREGGKLTLTLPSGWLSASHARIRRDDDRWLLEDLESRNGTHMEGKPVVHVALRDGDVIEAGRVLLIFREALHAPPGPPDLDSRTAAFPAPHLSTMIPALAAEMDALVRIAASPVPVLLRGETGAGKEVVARAVHVASRRAGSFVAVNCGAIPAALVESQLFGHTKGAFSGAVRDEPGFVRASNGGTLFLDEIGDLPATSQSALLRVLQEREVIPVGATRPLQVDLRVVAATHQPLEALVARGSFRSDLLGRLDGFAFVLPPLRERREDTGLLVADLLAAMPGSERIKLSIDAGRALLRYAWPQNVRELGHGLARSCALVGPDGVLGLAHFAPQLRSTLGASTDTEATPEDDDTRLRGQIEALLMAHEGNIAEVARAMGKARMQVHRWLKRFEIDPERYRR